jgi:predicted permease
MSFWSRIMNTFRSDQLHREIEEELQAHIQEAVEQGRNPAEARRAFGPTLQIREQTRDVQIIVWLDSLFRNIGYALRQLRKNPGFTTIVIFTLALGIGANTAIYTLLDQALLRSLPVKNPEELVYLYNPGPLQGYYIALNDEPGRPAFNYPTFRELQQYQTPFIGLAGARSWEVNLAYKGQASVEWARLVSGNYFSLLGVQPALGRLFTEDDDRTLGGHPVVILNYAFWSSRFANDPAILNQTIVINGYPMTIVGVAQKGFTSESLSDVPSLYVPITMAKALIVGWDPFTDRRNCWIDLFGRLRPGIGIEQAAAEINVPYRGQLEQDIAVFNQPTSEFLEQFRAKKIVLKAGPRPRGGPDESRSRPLLLLMAMTVLVLIICCANIANLQLARGTAQYREIALRLAIGASRSGIVSQLLVESCLLALTGGLLGIAIANLTLHGILAVIPSLQLLRGIPLTGVDSRVLLYSFGLMGLTAILFGVFPALHVSKPDLVRSLKESGRQSTSGERIGASRGALVSFQVALSLTLLIASALFGHTLMNLGRVDLGLREDHLLTFSVNPQLNQYSDVRTSQFYSELTERLRALSGVAQVTSAEIPAIAGLNFFGNIRVDDFEDKGNPNEEGVLSGSQGGAEVSPDQAYSNRVGPYYFETMGMVLLAGRDFTPLDAETSSKVAIVNEEFVRHFLPSQNVIGRRLGSKNRDMKPPDIEIIGIVRNARYSSVRDPVPRTYYVPYRQYPPRLPLYFYVWTTIDPEQIAPLVRREVAALDSGVPIREMKTMEAQVGETLAVERLMSLLTSLFGSLATLLAVVGLYGVLSYSVGRRTREIGIRIALGARTQDILRDVVGQGAKLSFLGVIIGVAVSFWSTRFIENQLYGIAPTDPVTFAVVPLLLIGIALLASYVPARRAARVDPIQALRAE